MAEALLEAGASTGGRDAQGLTPLALAARRGEPALVALLLRWGASDATAVEWAAHHLKLKQHTRAALSLAGDFDGGEACARLLADSQTVAALREDGVAHVETLRECAAADRRAAVADLHGADTDATDAVARRDLAARREAAAAAAERQLAR